MNGRWNAIGHDRPSKLQRLIEEIEALAWLRAHPVLI
tara:strand:+ start:184 stop:294 length:111 start_codon:yes stop_codon:yes gene_type:complete